MAPKVYCTIQAPSGKKPQLSFSSEEAHIRYTLKAAILTQRHARRFYPYLGSEILDSMFRAQSPEVLQDIKDKIGVAIKESEPRIELKQIDLNTHSSDKTQMMIHLGYEIKKTGKRDQLRLSLDI